MGLFDRMIVARKYIKRQNINASASTVNFLARKNCRLVDSLPDEIKGFRPPNQLNSRTGFEPRWQFKYRKGDARPLGKPHSIVPASRGGAKWKYNYTRGVDVMMTAPLPKRRQSVACAAQLLDSGCRNGLSDFVLHSST